MKNFSDDELIEGYSSTLKTEYVSEIFVRYSDVAFRTAMQFVFNEADAEDAVQSSFIKFMRDFKQYEPGTNLKAWLMRIVVNTCKDKYKSEKRRSIRQTKYSERLDRTREDEDQAEKLEMQKVVRSSVAMLPEKYRTPIWLVLFEGFSYGEASRSLELPEKTLRTQVARGLDRLKGVLLKSGVALSVPLILNVISETRLEAASGVFKMKCAKLATVKSSASSAFAATVPKTSGFLIKSLMVFLAISVGGAVFVNHNFQVKTPSTDVLKPVVVDRASEVPKGYTIDFNDEASIDLDPVYNDYVYEPNKGLGKSGCINIKTSVCFKLNLPFSGNAKISYKVNFKNLQGDYGGTECMPSEFGEMYSYNNLGDLLRTDPKKNSYLASRDEDWTAREIYITDYGLAQYSDGKISSYKIFKEKVGDEIFLWIHSPGYLDDLKVEPTDKNPMAEWHDDWLFEVNKVKESYPTGYYKKFALSDKFKKKYKIKRNDSNLMLYEASPKGSLEKRLKVELKKKYINW